MDDSGQQLKYFIGGLLKVGGGLFVTVTGFCVIPLAAVVAGLPTIEGGLVIAAMLATGLAIHWAGRRLRGE